MSFSIFMCGFWMIALRLAAVAPGLLAIAANGGASVQPA